MKLIAQTLASTLFAVSLLACAGSADTSETSRWKPYAGCNESQCRSWNSACEADCLNKKKADTDSCTNQCRAHMDECKQSCK